MKWVIHHADLLRTSAEPTRCSASSLLSAHQIQWCWKIQQTFSQMVYKGSLCWPAKKILDGITNAFWSTASGCMTRLYRQYSAYSGPRIPDVREILASRKKSNEDRFDRKIDLFKPWICTSGEENIHWILYRNEISTVWKMGHLLWENKSVPNFNIHAAWDLFSLVINRIRGWSQCVSNATFN